MIRIREAMMRLATAIVIITWMAGIPVLAKAEPIAGDFTASQDCPALQSLRKGTNPGEIKLVPGTVYPVEARGGENNAQLRIVVEGARPAQRWVPLTCGALAERPLPQPPTFSPFFDEKDEGAGDSTPLSPLLSGFDRAVLDLCGRWGSKVNEDEFAALLTDPAYTQEFRRIYAELRGSVRAAGTEPEVFAREMAEIWFSEQGFRHVFCGEPGAEKLGGLHYVGRYLQMQQEGWGGLAEASACSPGAREIVPPIYTLGVAYRLASGNDTKVDCVKGYDYALDAAALLIEATRAWKHASRNLDKGGACLHRMRHDGRELRAVFVTDNRRRGIVTFYPDATPKPDMVDCAAPR